MKPIEVKALMKIDDGLHKGVVVGVDERTDPYHYVDIHLEFEKGKTLKAGYPACLTTESMLGKLLARFGADVSTPQTFIDPEEIMMGKQCQFMTMNEEKGDRTYANVLPESLKPTEVAPAKLQNTQ